MSGSGPGFRLLDMSLHTEDEGRLVVDLGGRAGEAGPLRVPEGAVVSVGLTFQVGRAVDGLTFEEVRTGDDREPVVTRTPLGGFRRGGPYEVRLPPRRMPVGRAHCGLYEVTGRLTDGRGHELARADHELMLVHLTGAPEARTAPGDP
ncbi:hypothetical protein HHL19_20930 [Streptomyces sp. R302]|uniref:hypothetical protein n=1 Tax=unclassified Streptomyces TaxID=2593676 RepID=UPI00145CE306|nr:MULTISPECIES: hypothetical protein [unclassified Streptomyces]NML50972.1 hypothetical protein [Streptomyces sp. R301]NML81066.1 hypothetical protein [Streptomyces sp. R302]